MLESIKTQLWEFLKKKEISLVMIFNQNGDILWHRGRPIEGKSIHLGSGFSKSFAKRVIAHGNISPKATGTCSGSWDNYWKKPSNVLKPAAMPAVLSASAPPWTESGK